MQDKVKYFFSRVSPEKPKPCWGTDSKNLELMISLSFFLAQGQRGL